MSMRADSGNEKTFSPSIKGYPLGIRSYPPVIRGYPLAIPWSLGDVPKMLGANLLALGAIPEVLGASLLA